MFDQMIAQVTGQSQPAIDKIIASLPVAADKKHHPSNDTEHSTEWMTPEQLKRDGRAQYFLSVKFRPLIALRADGMVRAFRTLQSVERELGVTRKTVILHLLHNRDLLNGLRFAYYTEPGVFTDTGSASDRAIKSPLLVCVADKTPLVTTTTQGACAATGGDPSQVRHMLVSGTAMRMSKGTCTVRFATIDDLVKYAPVWYPRGHTNHVLAEPCSYHNYINGHTKDFFKCIPNSKGHANVKAWQAALAKRNKHV